MNPQKPQELTARECEVLKLIAIGTGFKDAAKTLGVCRQTVDKHTQSIYRKLRIHSVVSATHYALHVGAVENLFAKK